MNRERVTIRRAGPDDAATLAELAARIFRDTFADSNTPEDMAAYLAGAFRPDRQRAEIAAPGACTLLAEVDGPVGFAQIRTGAAPACVRTERPVELWRFYVDRSWHGRGVAHALRRAVLRGARALGAGSVWLGVWEHNARALAFYAKHGFVAVGEHEFRLGRDVQTDLLLVLPDLPDRSA